MGVERLTCRLGMQNLSRKAFMVGGQETNDQGQPKSVEYWDSSMLPTPDPGCAVRGRLLMAVCAMGLGAGH